MADPDSILLELGQSTGHNPNAPRHNPNAPRHVKSLLAQDLEDSDDVEIAAFEDLAGCSVRMLNPGRTLVEKLLRVNTFASLEPEERKDHHWPRIGRQYYDIWALLEVDEVREFLESPDIMGYVDDCIVQSTGFGGDAPVPTGGFAASAAFDVNTDLARLLRAQHELAMRDLYYGTETGRPSFDQTVERVIQSAALLDVAK